MLLRQSLVVLLSASSSPFLAPELSRSFASALSTFTFSAGKQRIPHASTFSESAFAFPATSGKLYSLKMASSSSTDCSGDVTTAADVTETMRAQAHSQMTFLQSKFPTLSSYKADRSNLPRLLTTSKEVSNYVASEVDAILFDCDGVLYRGTDPIPHAAEALSSLVASGKQIFFVTNNAGSNRRQLRDKLAKLLNMDSLAEEQMVSSSYSAARYLQRELLGDKNDGGDNNGAAKPRVHVIGTSGLCAEIESAGFDVQGGPSDDPRSGMSREELAAYPFPYFADSSSAGGRVDAFVVGLDNEFNYRKLCISNVLMQHNPDAMFVATNEDAFDLVGVHAYQLPGNGALVKALEHSSGRKAVCVGKPSPLLAELIADDHGLDVGRTLFVGDRLDTDIRFAVESGMQSALALTGCTTAERVVELCGENIGGGGAVDEPMPNVIFPHMGMMKEGCD